MENLIGLNDKKVLEYQLRQIYASVVRSYKLQDYQANVYMRRNNTLELLKILTTTITTSGVIGSLVIGDNSFLERATAIVSMIALFITTYTKTYNLEGLHKQFKDNALSFLDLKERVLTLLYALRVESSNMDEITEERDKIVEDLNKLHVNPKLVCIASKHFISKYLKPNGNGVYTEDQIDSILPSILTLGRKKMYQI